MYLLNAIMIRTSLIIFGQRQDNNEIVIQVMMPTRSQPLLKKVISVISVKCAEVVILSLSGKLPSKHKFRLRPGSGSCPSS